MKMLILASIAALPVMALSADNTAQMFYTQAAQGGMAEVELGRLASTKGASEGVKSFGKQMVTDHTQANDKLKTIAMKKGVSLPTQPAPDSQQVKTKLEKLSGDAFNTAYIESQVKDHDKTIALLEKEISSGKDPEAKAWATETLPVVRQHASMIKTMSSGKHASH